MCGILRERSPTLFLSAEPPWEMPPCFLSKIKPFVPFSAGSCVAGGEAMQCDTEDKCKCMIVTPEGSIIRIGGKQPKPETDPDWEDRQALSARQSVSAAASSELCVHSRSSRSVLSSALCVHRRPSTHPLDVATSVRGIMNLFIFMMESQSNNSCSLQGYSYS